MKKRLKITALTKPIEIDRCTAIDILRKKTLSKKHKLQEL